MTHYKGSPQEIARLLSEMGSMAELVANGASIQEAGRTIGLDRNRSCKVWKRVREKLGVQAV